MKASSQITLLLTAALFLSGATTACSLWPRKSPLTWHLVLRVDAPPAEREALVNRARAVIEKRLDAIGIRNFEITTQGSPQDGRLLLRLPTVPSPARLKDLVTAAGKLELVHVISPPSPAPVQTYPTRTEAVASVASDGIVPKEFRVLPVQDQTESRANGSEKWLVVGAMPVVTGEDLRTAMPFPGAINDRYEIMFHLNEAGAEKLGMWTAANINQYLAVVLNDEVKSTAFVKSKITDTGEISGNFTRQMAEDLALTLKSGMLPVHLTILEEQVDR
ncbi:MAG TPA: hypothetical protein VE961_06370 [Pyrinomonadaceae bacterium]|nr:hypothetical protein [Pyrinomonadaceae bacterium]